MAERIGIIHPGAMGIYVAASIANSGYEICWASEGRSPATVHRAEKYELRDVGDLNTLCHSCDVMVSVCPPHAALEMAEQVVSHSFAGIYLDANAISPRKARNIGTLVEKAGISFVDGGIIGGPIWENGNTRLYLSGGNAEQSKRFFAGGPIKAASIGDEVGKASAIKMCYAAYTKGTSALLANILALAESQQVRDDLAARWEEDWPGLYDASKQRIKKAALKAWRFEGEMREVSETFTSAGLPGDFHHGAALLYERLEGYKNHGESLDFDQILHDLLGRS